jgi:hypothetical protein
MSRVHVLILCICLMVVTMGCSNRSNGYGPSWISSSPTVAPPPTYSLNIPSVARNQPYYNPTTSNAGAQPNGAPTNATPPPAAPATPAQLNGWIPKSDSPSTPAGSANPSTTGQPPIPAGTQFAAAPPLTGIQTASNTAMPASGASFTDSANYRTTSIDETRDETRLPATDASQVRAPAFGNPARQPTQFSAMPVPPASGYTGGPVYAGQPVIATHPGVGGPPVYTAQPTTGYPASYQATPTVNTGGTVLAQSTTTYDAGNGSQLGWRDREIQSGSYSR